jgi:hypothetical protein
MYPVSRNYGANNEECHVADAYKRERQKSGGVIMESSGEECRIFNRKVEVESTKEGGSGS